MAATRPPATFATSDSSKAVDSDASADSSELVVDAAGGAVSEMDVFASNWKSGGMSPPYPANWMHVLGLDVGQDQFVYANVFNELTSKLSWLRLPVGLQVLAMLYLMHVQVLPDAARVKLGKSGVLRAAVEARGPLPLPDVSMTFDAEADTGGRHGSQHYSASASQYGRHIARK